MRHPKAEAYAKTCPLPMTVCLVTKELYGYAHPTLDEREAVKHASNAGFDNTEVEVILDILQERAERLRKP